MIAVLIREAPVRGLKYFVLQSPLEALDGFDKSGTMKVHLRSERCTACLRSLLTSLSMPRSVGSSLASTCSLNRSPARVRRYRASSAGFRGIFAASRGLTATRFFLGGISTRYERMGGSGVGRVVCRGTVKKPPSKRPQTHKIETELRAAERPRPPSSLFPRPPSPRLTPPGTFSDPRPPTQPHFHANHGAYTRRRPRDRASHGARIAVPTPPDRGGRGKFFTIVGTRCFAPVARARRPPLACSPASPSIRAVRSVHVTHPITPIRVPVTGRLQARLRRLLRQVPQEHPQARPGGHQGQGEVQVRLRGRSRHARLLHLRRDRLLHPADHPLGHLGRAPVRSGLRDTRPAASVERAPESTGLF